MTTNPRVDEMNHADLPEDLQYHGYWSMRARPEEIGNQSKIYYALSSVKNPPRKLVSKIAIFKHHLDNLNNIYKKMGRIQKTNNFRLEPYTGPAVKFEGYSKQGDRLNTHLNELKRNMCNEYPALKKICASIEFAKQRKLAIGAELYRNQIVQQAVARKSNNQQQQFEALRDTTEQYHKDSAMNPGEAPTTYDAAAQEKGYFKWPDFKLTGKGKKSAKKSKKTYKKTSKKSKTHKRKMH